MLAGMPRLLTPVVLAAALLALLVSPSSAAQERKMTEDRAAVYYTNHVCPVSRAQDKYFREVWGDRRFISRREIARRLPELRRLADDFAPAVYNWARDLYNPPAAWPDNVASLVERLAAVNLRYSDLLWLQADAHNARRWINLNERINDLPFRNYAATIRARLDLPRRTDCRR